MLHEVGGEGLGYEGLVVEFFFEAEVAEDLFVVFDGDYLVVVLEGEGADFEEEVVFFLFGEGFFLGGAFVGFEVFFVFF